MKFRTFFHRILSLIFLFLAGLESQAQEEASLLPDPPEPSGSYVDELPPDARQIWEQDYLTGDWGGARTWLLDHGIDFEMIYYGGFAANLSGGIQTGIVSQGLVFSTLTIDFEKLADFKGSSFYISMVYPHAAPFSMDYVGDINFASLIDLRNSLRLWQMWYEQHFFDNIVSLRVGQMTVDWDFATTEVSLWNFSNQNFFFPTLLFNVPLPSSPLAAPGVRLKIQPNDSFYFKVAVYDGNPDPTLGNENLNDSGTRFSLNEDDGALLFFEGAYLWNQGPEDKGLPGTLKIGGMYHTAFFDDNRLDRDGRSILFGGAPREHHGNYAVYAIASQMLYRETTKEDPAQQGLSGFWRILVAPEDRNLFSWQGDTGLVYRGPLPGRDFDTMGLAFNYLAISDEISKLQRESRDLFGAPSFISDYEAVIELTYKVQVTPWMIIQPDLQWIFHPGGSGKNPDAVTFILLTNYRF